MHAKQSFFTTALLAFLSSALLAQLTRNWLKTGYNFLAGTEIGAALGAAIGAYIGSTLGLAMGEVQAFLCMELLRRLIVPAKLKKPATTPENFSHLRA